MSNSTSQPANSNLGDVVEVTVPASIIGTGVIIVRVVVVNALSKIK